jgi:hypothetical protein
VLKLIALFLFSGTWLFVLEKLVIGKPFVRFVHLPIVKNCRMYFINKGACDVILYKPGMPPFVVNELKTGDYFGEVSTAASFIATLD